MIAKLRSIAFFTASALSLAAYGQSATVRQIDVHAGDLVGALDNLAQQTGAQFIYRADQLRGLSTPGVHGNMTAADALSRLLKGSGYGVRQDASGAAVIVKEPAAPQARPAPQSQPAAAGEPEPTNLETVMVTGSRIPRAQIEGPAPVVVITAEDIKADGFTSVPDVLRAITQNGGETQSQQSASGADFSPGAQQVDLRGLGPNHSLVLVNGRRIADFPLPFKGRSNFTDISSIPLGMIQRIEILTGSASAVYGSDAIAGVVNIILKDKADGTTLDYRYGDTSRGGAGSQRFSLSSGFSNGSLNGVFGLELQDQKPLWAYQRSIQDSTKDAPTAGARIARRVFLRTDYYDTYLDPGADTCNALSGLNGGTTYYASRPRYGDYDDDLGDYGPGYYCGSDEAIGYGTILSKRRSANAYGSLTYNFGDDHNTQWFADVQLGYQKLELFRDVEQWWYMAPDGNEAGYFYNQATDQIEYWQRQFTPEEMGGLDKGMIGNIQRTFSLSTGFKGTFAHDWDYEAALSHSQYHATISWPQTIAGAANDFFLGPSLGIDEDSELEIFNADPSRLFTPLTQAEYDAITADTVYHPKTRTDTLSFSATQADLFELPGGPAGFAAIAEYGSQSYAINPDPLALEYYYLSWKDSDGRGSRTRWAGAGELRMPLLESLNLSVAGRYDQYRFAGRDVGKPTWSAGVEWRPIDTLLLRGSYGTAFRAPDLHYVFAGPGNDETGGTDYYRCRTEQPDLDISDCDYSDEGLIRSRNGSKDLDPETSTAWTAGVLWSPSANFDVSIDWFDIRMKNQVQDLSVDSILQDEADCRIGQKPDGTPVDINSPTCQDAIARVTRLSNGKLYGIHVNPINVARENTSGLDLTAHYRLDTRIGTFRLSGNYTWVHDHEFQQYPGDPVIDEFAVNSGYDIPRTKASASLSWSRKAWSATLHGERLGRLPNYWSYEEVVDLDAGDPAWIGATYLYNASVQYSFSDHAQLALMVDNLMNKMPPKDSTYSAYPYYDISWFDSVGRSFYLQFTWKFGGEPL